MSFCSKRKKHDARPCLSFLNPKSKRRSGRTIVLAARIVSSQEGACGTGIGVIEATSKHAIDGKNWNKDLQFLLPELEKGSFQPHHLLLFCLKARKGDLVTSQLSYQSTFLCKRCYRAKLKHTKRQRFESRNSAFFDLQKLSVTKKENQRRSTVQAGWMALKKFTETGQEQPEGWQEGTK